MKTLLVTLLFFPVILFAQEPDTKPQEPKGERREIGVDTRCESAVVWSTSLINSKQEGKTLNEIVQQMWNNYRFGSLRGTDPDTIMYMLAIASYIFEYEGNRNIDEAIEALEEVNEMCVAFINDKTLV
jgi:hypothetical protein